MRPTRAPGRYGPVVVSTLSLVCMLLGARPGAGAADDPPQPGPADDLRLIVVVVIDQLRGDALVRFDRLFGPDGFRRLREGGVWYQNAFFDHAHTVTGVGHATIGTGALPAAHGIVGNDWIDRRSGRSVNCVSDPTSPIVGAETTGNASPAQLLSTTFADEWIFATTGRARAFGVSGKDRGAILPVGPDGEGLLVSRRLRPHGLEPVLLSRASRLGRRAQPCRPRGEVRREELGARHPR